MNRNRNQGTRRFDALWLPLLASLLLAGCAGDRNSGTDGDLPGHPLTGEILKVDKERGVLLVAHDEIDGYMPAMTMEFRVSGGDMAIAEEGQRIRARMVRSEGTYRLERIWPHDEAAERTVEIIGRRLRQDTVIRGERAYREVGEALPEFALYDQNARVVQARHFRGKRLVLNFIFTRCAVPDMCPAATQRMATLQETAQKKGKENFHLLSISLDPEYDTPGVLKEYARNYGIDTEYHSFLTGPDRAIEDLMRQLGILTQVEGGILNHTMATLLVDTDGTILHRADGSLWSIHDFIDLL